MASVVENAIRQVVGAGVEAISAFNRRHRSSDTPNAYLTGVHTPMSTEETLTDLRVVGHIPEGLNGLYVRNGPNPLEAPNPATHHWFLGDGMLHGVRFEAGRALWYRNRWIRSERVSRALGETPAPGVRHGHQDNPNTNVIGHAGRIWAIVEAGGFPAEISETLETLRHNPFDGTLETAYSAHPHLDPETGELHAICYYGRDPSLIWHTVVGVDGHVRRREPIEVRNGPSIHDCMITKRFVIVMDLPVTFSMPTLISGSGFPYRWNPSHPARIGLLPREGAGSEIIWCDIDPCYIFHVANAFERDDGVVVMDACVHASMFSSDFHGPDSPDLKFERLVIDPATRSVVRSVVDPDPQEFPRIDERLTGRPYRFAYAVGSQATSNASLSDGRLLRHDLETGERLVRDFGPERYPGEFVFVPAHAGASETEGWLMGLVIDAARSETDLFILDARNMTGDPLAVVSIPHVVPPGFHGNFIPLPGA
jgi:carotenoid cleavage dioxygenase